MAQMVLARRTTADEVDEIGLHGQPICTYWPQIRQYLREAPDPIQKVIFAEPVRDRENGDVEWYVQTDGELLRYADLDDDGKRHVATIVADALRWVEGESKRLADSADANDRLLGEILTAAFEVPSLDELYATNHHPVIISWGTFAPGPRPERGVLARTFLSEAPILGRHEGTILAPPAPLPLVISTGNTVLIKSNAGSLAMVVGGASLAAAIVFALYSSCGIRIPLLNTVFFERCEADLSSRQFDSLTSLFDEERVLRDRLASLNAELTEMETECRIDGELSEPRLPLQTSTFDFPEPIPCGGEATESGGQGRERHTLLLGSEPGRVEIRYCMDTVPDALDALYKGQVIASTGGAVSGSDVLSFEYQPVDGDYELVIDMIAERNQTQWQFVVSCPGQAAAQC